MMLEVPDSLFQSIQFDQAEAENFALLRLLHHPKALSFATSTTTSSTLEIKF
jgi:hypothetical protein